MSIIEILEAHLRVMGQRGTSALCICGWHAEALGKRSEDLHRAHVAQVLEQHAREREAAAVRETSRNLERLYPCKGLVNRAGVLADIEIAADRIGRGIHANGRDKVTK